MDEVVEGAAPLGPQGKVHQSMRSRALSPCKTSIPPGIVPRSVEKISREERVNDENVRNEGGPPVSAATSSNVALGSKGKKPLSDRSRAGRRQGLGLLTRYRRAKLVRGHPRKVEAAESREKEKEKEEAGEEEEEEEKESEADVGGGAHRSPLPFDEPPRQEEDSPAATSSPPSSVNKSSPPPLPYLSASHLPSPSPSISERSNHSFDHSFEGFLTSPGHRDMATPNMRSIPASSATPPVPAVPSSSPAASDSASASPSSFSSATSVKRANVSSSNQANLSLVQTYDSPVYDASSPPATPQTVFRANALSVALDESRKYEDSIMDLSAALDQADLEVRKCKEEMNLLRQENLALKATVAETETKQRDYDDLKAKCASLSRKVRGSLCWWLFLFLPTQIRESKHHTHTHTHTRTRKRTRTHAPLSCRSK